MSQLSQNYPKIHTLIGCARKGHTQTWLMLAVAGLALIGLMVVVIAGRGASVGSTAGDVLPESTGSHRLEHGPKHLVFCSDSWQPYAGVAGTERPGFIIDLLALVYAEEGYSVEYVNRPWSRCIEEVRLGRLTALAGADREEVKDFIFPESIVGVTVPTFYVHSKSEWSFHGLESLQKVRVGVIQHYTYSREFDEYINENLGDEHRVYVATGDDALRRMVKLVQEGRLDVLIENAPVVEQLLRDPEWAHCTLREAGRPGAGAKLYVPFSPNIPHSLELTDIFDRRMVELRQSGMIQELLHRYQLPDWIE